MKIYSAELLNMATAQSNLIEGEPTTGPSFDNHLRATEACFWAARSGQVLHPHILHRLLFDANDERAGFWPGAYRIVDVYTRRADGSNLTFPSHHDVPILMGEWWREYTKHLTMMYGGPDLRDESVRFDFHAWFEAIHPFPDGNGRVGRLVWWNMAMLVNATLPIISAKERQRYYDDLEKWRKANVTNYMMNPFMGKRSG